MSEDEVVRIVLAVLDRIASNAGAQGRDNITTDDIANVIAHLQVNERVEKVWYSGDGGPGGKP